MLNLETAKKLKDAGLKWEPKLGDLFAYVDDGEELREQWEIASTNIYAISGEKHLVDELGGRMVFFGGGLCVRGTGCRTNETYCSCMNKTGFNPDLKVYSVASWEKKLWLPRLDQLLAEIEKRGYVWKLRSRADGKYFVALFGKNDENYLVQCYWTEADSPEEAAAQALIWILKQEG